MATANPNYYFGYASDGTNSYSFGISVSSFPYDQCPLANYQNVNGEYCAANTSSGACPDSGADSGAPDYCPVADPISHATGNNLLVQEDFVGGGTFPLTFRRYYNSAFGIPGVALRSGWRGSVRISVCEA